MDGECGACMGTESGWLSYSWHSSPLLFRHGAVFRDIHDASACSFVLLQALYGYICSTAPRRRRLHDRQSIRARRDHLDPVLIKCPSLESGASRLYGASRLRPWSALSLSLPSAASLYAYILPRSVITAFMLGSIKQAHGRSTETTRS